MISIWNTRDKISLLGLTAVQEIILKFQQSIAPIWSRLHFSAVRAFMILDVRWEVYGPRSILHSVTSQ